MEKLDLQTVQKIQEVLKNLKLTAEEKAEIKKKLIAQMNLPAANV